MFEKVKKDISYNPNIIGANSCSQYMQWFS